MTDESLWKALRNGEAKALEFIYRREVDHLYSYAVRFTRDESMVMDAIQDTFEEVWNKRKNVSQQVIIRPYLMTAVRRRVLYIMKRKKNVFDITDFEIDFAELENRETQWIKSEEAKESHIKLHQSMEFLSARQKEALYLRFFQNLSYDDICTIMDINYQSVRNLISQALKKIKEEWK